MILHELIDFRGTPSPAPLPVPANELIELLKASGDHWEDKVTAVRFMGQYDPNRFEKVQALISTLSLPLTHRHSIWPEYEAADYSAAPLWAIHGIPEIWIQGVDLEVKCPKCARKWLKMNTTFHPSNVTWNRPILSVNGQFTIVRSDVANRVKSELTGCDIQKFDNDGRYYYFLSSCLLQGLIIRPNEVIGYRGLCEGCSQPLFDKWFGPLRYSANQWNGEDVAYCDWRCRNVYSPKTFHLLQEFEKAVFRSEVVLFEDH